MKILNSIGVRPQIIKAGRLSREISKYENIEEIIMYRRNSSKVIIKNLLQNRELI